MGGIGGRAGRAGSIRGGSTGGLCGSTGPLGGSATGLTGSTAGLGGSTVFGVSTGFAVSMGGASAGAVVAAASSVRTSAARCSVGGASMAIDAGGATGPAGTAARGACSTVGASNVTTSGLIRNVAVRGARRLRGVGSAMGPGSAAGFFRAGGFTSISATPVAAVFGAAFFARGVRRVVALIGVPVPGRIVRTGIFAAGRDRTSRADSSSTELLKVVTSMPDVWSRSMTSLVVRRNFVAKSYTRTVPTPYYLQQPHRLRRDPGPTRPTTSRGTVAPTPSSRFPGRTSRSAPPDCSPSLLGKRGPLALRPAGRPLLLHPAMPRPLLLYPAMPRRRSSIPNRSRAVVPSRLATSRRKARASTLRCQAFSRQDTEGQRYALRPRAWGGLMIRPSIGSNASRTSSCRS